VRTSGAPPVSARATRADRVLAAFIAAGILAVLTLAAGLRPDPSGMGTHQQLGLPPCGWIASMGMPCPTCGMTTAFADAATARPLASLAAQPMGTALAVGGAAAFWASLHVLIFGSRLGSVVVRGLRPRLLWVVAAIWAASWVYKILVVKQML
jgi:hypothetical protein